MLHARDLPSEFRWNRILWIDMVWFGAEREWGRKLLHGRGRKLGIKKNIPTDLSTVPLWCGQIAKPQTLQGMFCPDRHAVCLKLVLFNPQWPELSFWRNGKKREFDFKIDGNVNTNKYHWKLNWEGEYRTNSPLISASFVRHSLLHFHLSHMAVHHLHHLRYHRLHLLLLAQYFILNSRLGSSANPFLHRPFHFLQDWFHGLSDHLMILLCSTAGYVCMVC